MNITEVKKILKKKWPDFEELIREECYGDKRNLDFQLKTGFKIEFLALDGMCVHETPMAYRWRLSQGDWSAVYQIDSEYNSWGTNEIKIWDFYEVVEKEVKVMQWVRV